MSSPHPEGLGARLAINGALASAGLGAADVGYVNLHGTASARNDEVEAAVVADLFPPSTLAGSTKGWTGHALGAAGFLEAAICLEALAAGRAPGMLTTTNLDPSCGPQIRTGPAPIERPFALSNSFGFGGSNCVLAFGSELRP
jgi:3-oxoacyl-[acyl-carrier-protein] synthase-1